MPNRCSVVKVNTELEGACWMNSGLDRSPPAAEAGFPLLRLIRHD